MSFASLGDRAYRAITQLKDYQSYALWGTFSLVIALVLLIILPSLGITKFAMLLSPITLCFISGGVIGAYGYFLYIKHILKHPEQLFLFYVLTSDFLNFMLHIGEKTLGMSFKITTLENLIYMTPLVLLIFMLPKRNNISFPFVKYLVAFFIVTVLYYVFYNQHAQDMLFKSVAGEYNDISWGRLIALMNITILLVATSKFMQSLVNPEKFFDLFNKYYLGLIICFSLMAIVFYPFNILTVVIETKRMALFFTHPNSLARYLSLSMCFLMGIGFYYLQKKSMRKVVILFATLPLILIALTTCGSKSYFITTLIACALILVLEIIFNKQRFGIFKNPKLLGLTSGIILIGAVLGVNLGVLDGLQQRFKDDGSLRWRYSQWHRIIQNMNPDNFILGNGHTAALTVTTQYVYNTWNMRNGQQESPYVHNTFLEHFYDYGVFGLLWLIGFLHCLIIHIKGMLNRKIDARFRSIHIACIAIIFMQLSTLFVEETFYISSPLSIWFLLTIQFYIAKSTEISQPSKFRDLLDRDFSTSPMNLGNEPT